MPRIFEDKGIEITGSKPDDIRDFQIAWLNRRVENLEAIVFELLRDRVNYGLIEGYQKTLDNPGFGPNSQVLKDRGKQLAELLQGEYPVENLGWPAKK